MKGDCLSLNFFTKFCANYSSFFKFFEKYVFILELVLDILLRPKKWVFNMYKTVTVERHYSRAEIARIKKALFDLKMFRGNPKVEAFTRMLEKNLQA